VALRIEYQRLQYYSHLKTNKYMINSPI